MSNPEQDRRRPPGRNSVEVPEPVAHHLVDPPEVESIATPVSPSIADTPAPPDAEPKDAPEVP